MLKQKTLLYNELDPMALKDNFLLNQQQPGINSARYPRNIGWAWIFSQNREAELIHLMGVNGKQMKDITFNNILVG